MGNSSATRPVEMPNKVGKTTKTKKVELEWFTVKCSHRNCDYMTTAFIDPDRQMYHVSTKMHSGFFGDVLMDKEPYRPRIYAKEFASKLSGKNYIMETEGGLSMPEGQDEDSGYIISTCKGGDTNFLTAEVLAEADIFKDIADIPICNESIFGQTNKPKRRGRPKGSKDSKPRKRRG